MITLFNTELHQGKLGRQGFYAFKLEYNCLSLDSLRLILI